MRASFEERAARGKIVDAMHAAIAIDFFAPPDGYKYDGQRLIGKREELFGRIPGTIVVEHIWIPLDVERKGIRAFTMFLAVDWERNRGTAQRSQFAKNKFESTSLSMKNVFRYSCQVPERG